MKCPLVVVAFLSTGSVACSLDSTLSPQVDSQMIDTSIDEPPAAACNPTAPFGVPVAVAGVNGPGVDCDAWLSRDGLTIFFRSDRAGGQGLEDLWTATRATTSDTFGTATPVANINSIGFDNKPSFTADELTIFFGSGNPAQDIRTATRSSTTAPFGPPATVANLNSGMNDNPGTINDAGTVLFMSSDRTGDNDIYQATRVSPAAAFAAPVRVDELSIAGMEDSSPVLSADQLTIFFSSSRPGGVGGSSDIWTATRSTPTGTFGTPVDVPELSSAVDEQPTWLSPDGCQILIMSSRGGANQDIFLATRPL